jgi:ATP-dependent DNA helicase RecQ
MVSSGYLRVEGTEYPTLEVTSIGREVLQGLRPFELEQRADTSSRGPGQKPCRVAAVPTGIPVPLLPDRQLVERLRQLRSELAEEEGVAPFLIFHDKTLKAIAGSKPESRAALLEIPGIGEMKAERYGRRVLAVINGVS